MRRDRASFGRRGVTTTEFFFAILILAFALIPIYDIFIGSYKTVFRSKYAYIGQHMARETMEELRQVPFDKLAAKQHGWAPVSGHVLRITGSDMESPSDLSDVTLRYPEDYKRIETRLTIEELTDPNTGQPEERIKKAIIEIRWQEHGARGRNKTKILERFESLIANHSF